jgi:hypothetical protein
MASSMVLSIQVWSSITPSRPRSAIRTELIRTRVDEVDEQRAGVVDRRAAAASSDRLAGI